ncbi:MAG: TRADD-N-associated membrane domain-containing protein [Microcystaceae cyanobacterium]
MPDNTPIIHQESHSIYEERRRQARLAFNLAFVLTTISASIGCLSVLLLMTGNVSAGTLTAAGGGFYGTVSASWLRLSKDANDRLDILAKAIEDES